MDKKTVRTLYVRDTVSKTFHIVEDPEGGLEIDLHTDINNVSIVVPKEYHAEIMQVYFRARSEYADDVIVMEEVNVSGGLHEKEIGGPVQKIWEKSLLE